MDLLGGAERTQVERLWKKSDPKKLQKLEKSYHEHNDFQAGDIVTWKDGLKNRKFPEYGNPMVVMEFSEGNRDQREESGIPYYKEPLEVCCGMIDPGGDFMFFWFDANRLRKM